MDMYFSSVIYQVQTMAISTQDREGQHIDEKIFIN